MQSDSLTAHQFRKAGSPANNMSGERQLLIRALLTGNRWFDSIPVSPIYLACMRIMPKHESW